MLDRRRTSFFDRLGRALAAQSVTLRLAVALVGLLLFVGLSSLGVKLATDALSPLLPNNQAERSEANDLESRIAILTDAAKGCLLDAGLSTEHFLTQRSEKRAKGKLTYRRSLWEIAVPEDFAVDRVWTLLQHKDQLQGEDVELVHRQLDAKSDQLDIFLMGANTHHILFTKVAQESPEGGVIHLSYLPEGTTKIDVQAIPRATYKGPPRLAIIIDDIGRLETIDKLFFDLPARVTFSILPYSPNARRMAELAHGLDHEVMMHQPMEPLRMDQHDPGQGKVLLKMNSTEIAKTIEKNLQQVPFAVGVNNHMGSAYTADEEKMQAALAPIKKNGLFFLDSLTHSSSVAYRTAREFGLRTAVRNIFLDYKPEEEIIREQIRLAGRIAKAQGRCIAIGHPYELTYLALQAELPGLLKQGIEIVPVLQLVY